MIASNSDAVIAKLSILEVNKESGMERVIVGLFSSVFPHQLSSFCLLLV